MRKPDSLSEDKFDKLRRTQDSIQLVTMLLDEEQRPNSLTPQMMASSMALVGENERVLQPLGCSFSTH